jgi:ribosome-associated protein
MTGSDPLAKAVRVAKAAVDLKAENLVALDVRELTSFTDVFILATGGSDRHVRAIADAVEEAVEELGERPLGIEGYDEGRWLLLDLGDVIVHLFQRDVREHYDLERLWSEAPRLDLLDAEAVSVTQ